MPIPPLIARVRDTLDRRQNQVFLVDGATGRAWRYGEFHRLACGLAEGLREKGIRRGDRVAILLTNSPEFAALYFACLYLGAVAVPINTKLHPKECEFILVHCGARCLVTSSTTQGIFTPALLKTQGLTVWMVDEATLSIDKGKRSGWEPLEGVDPKDLFSITFTSGTTSQPKGVPHTIESLLGGALAFNEELGFGPDHRFYHVLAMAYMAGFLNTLLCPFMAGSSVLLGAAFDAQQALSFWDAPIRHQANTFWLVPTILSTLLRIDRNPAALTYCRENVKAVCVGTAPLPLKLKQEFETKYGVTLYESYGLSETLFVTTNSKRLAYHPGSVGSTLTGVTVKIIGENGTEQPAGEPGEILIRTPYRMTGYLNLETQKPNAMPEEWFASGDVGYLSENLLFITDRKKDLIIRGGLNISPKAIEDVLIQHPGVQQAVVVGLPDDFYGEEIAAAIKVKADYTFQNVRPALVELCKKNLSASSIPTRWEEVEEFPLGSTGKLQKRILRERLAGR